MSKQALRWIWNVTCEIYCFWDKLGDEACVYSTVLPQETPSIQYAMLYLSRYSCLIHRQVWYVKRPDTACMQLKGKKIKSCNIFSFRSLLQLFRRLQTLAKYHALRSALSHYLRYMARFERCGNLRCATGEAKDSRWKTSDTNIGNGRTETYQRVQCNVLLSR